MQRAWFLAALVAAACSTRTDTAASLQGITAESLRSEIQTLSSDEFAGRKPGTAGEGKTLAYLEQQFRALGLKPGNPDGTFVQKVPLAGILSDTHSNVSVKGRRVSVQPGQDFIAISHRFTETVDVKNSPIVFVGYGIVAPEYQWDDFKDVDVTGKTILMLVNDPQIPDPSDPSKLDPKMFRGNAMTYYGRWTYKYEIASHKHAAAAIIIHETGMAGYPFSVLTNSNGAEEFDIARPDKNMDRVPVESWITYDRAAELCRVAGLDLASLKKQALQRDFRPVSLPGAAATFHIRNKLRTIDSHNFIARYDDGDPHLKDEYVIYSAHWDHLGTGLHGEVYHGARDNASGVAGLIEMARAYTKLPALPGRSILFLSFTGEEQGLLGARYYAENPVYALNKTAADINLDELNIWGKSKSIADIGYGLSTLDDDIAAVLAPEGRSVSPDPEPEKGHYYRADHFELAKMGLPSIYFMPGPDQVQQAAKYDATDYHQPSDVINSSWDLSGAVEDLKAFVGLGLRIANNPALPQWKAGAEFKATRDAMMAAAAQP
jgi:Zn-dependent M28 family amino/carboxypeptidase